MVTGIALCRGDHNTSYCNTCFSWTLDILNLCPYYKTAWMWYEVYTFYEGPDMVRIDGISSIQVPPPVINKSTKKKSNLIALAITIPVVAAVLLLAVFCFCLYKKRSHGRKTFLSEKVNSGEKIENVDSLLIDLSTLKAATHNFHETNKLGEGGFGAVYKVLLFIPGILPNGQVVAVKRLSQSSGQGLEELKNELVLVAKLQQKNLVRVVGVCLGGQEKLLVYEFLPNRSLDIFLFGGTITDIIDPVLDCPISEMIRHVHIGLLCVQEDPTARPRMSQVVIMLSSETVSLEAPSKPAFCLKRGGVSYSERVSGDRSVQMAQDEISVAQLGPR
ncbi:Cysteine-rich receptor-like protein kinase 29 [Carex littledalei]|uniref:Cysteine-rich receptor-like protein kinase 29 n=1 Tax=Carex littledalei TaxID=544730 RepID=A0A833V1P5_9POAL|nr:Cysteine-rich receptor-like protein kinase 29 [Carex littledalei]